MYIYVMSYVAASITCFAFEMYFSRPICKGVKVWVGIMKSVLLITYAVGQILYHLATHFHLPYFIQCIEEKWIWCCYLLASRFSFTHYNRLYEIHLFALCNLEKDINYIVERKFYLILYIFRQKIGKHFKTSHRFLFKQYGMYIYRC